MNQLLGRERWARDRLAAFAGRSLELRPPLLPPLRLAILPDGTLKEGDAPPEAVVGLEGVTGGPLADELRLLGRHLRWDAEEELSKLVGDVAAHRVGEGARAVVRWHADGARRLAEALVGYGADEARLLIGRSEFEGLGRQVGEFEAAIAALERRISRLV